MSASFGGLEIGTFDVGAEEGRRGGEGAGSEVWEDLAEVVS